MSGIKYKPYLLLGPATILEKNVYGGTTLRQVFFLQWNGKANWNI